MRPGTYHCALTVPPPGNLPDELHLSKLYVSSHRQTAVELPASPEVDPIAAKNVQELLGGRFGEMLTIVNCTFQSFNMRGPNKIRPYYALVSNIAAEERVTSIVSAAINSGLEWATQGLRRFRRSYGRAVGQTASGREQSLPRGPQVHGRQLAPEVLPLLADRQSRVREHLGRPGPGCLHGRRGNSDQFCIQMQG